MAGLNQEAVCIVVQVPSLDIFATGVCLFILAWRVPPWGIAGMYWKCLSAQSFHFCSVESGRDKMSSSLSKGNLPP